MAMPNTRIVKLSQPLVSVFTSGETEREEIINEVTVNMAPKAKDLRCMDGRTGDVAQSIALIAQLTGLMEKQVDELALEDYVTLAEIAGELVPSGPPTGQTA